MRPTTAPGTACRSRRRRGWCRSSMAVPFVGSHPGRASGISAGCGGQPLPAAMWGLKLWLERDHLLNLDFDPTVVGIVPQLFWLHWIDAAGKPDSHAPDFFARQAMARRWWLTAGRRAAQAAGRREVRGDGAGLRAGGGGKHRLLGEVDVLVTAQPAVAGW